MYISENQHKHSTLQKLNWKKAKLCSYEYRSNLYLDLSKASRYAASSSADLTDTIFGWFADFTTYFDNFHDPRIFHKLGSACKVNSIQYLLTTENEAINQSHSK